jgi:CspA family cold shock protein
MSTGIVTWYDTYKGFGFILPDNGGTDILVNTSAVESAGLRGFAKGQRISFDIVEDRLTGEAVADNLHATRKS